MKIHLLIAFFLSSVAAAAEHPRDFVPDDAMAILSISNGDAINSILNTINKRAGMSDTENYINDILLKSLIDDPESVDLSSEILFVIAPPMYADDNNKVTNALLRQKDQLRFQKQGKDRILMSFG